jgi:signal transduction histidine kinase
MKLKSTSKKIVLLNEATLKSAVEKDNLTIIKNFTEVGIQILGADFGFAWWKLQEGTEYQLAYKSPTTPYEPTVPRESAGNYIARKTKKPFFDSITQKGDYEFDIGEYLKTYIIIPLYYNEVAYGSLVLCYKKKHIFTESELDLATVLGTATAQAITIHRLVVNEQRKHKKELLLKKIETLLQQEKMKTEFIANTAHELRTPLAIIKGNVDLAMRGGKKKQSSYDSTFRAINHEVSHLASILSDLTILTPGSETLNSKIVFNTVDLKKLITDIVVRSSVLARKKGISLIVKKIPPISMVGNKVYLQKMLINLVKNSIMYGIKNGRTEIKVKKKKGCIEISIADNGIGISKENVARIFERFFRASSTHLPGQEGTGLGLAIVKRAIEVHGGTSKVTSKLGKGTTFTISLPAAK